MALLSIYHIFHIYYTNECKFYELNIYAILLSQHHLLHKYAISENIKDTTTLNNK